MVETLEHEKFSDGQDSAVHFVNIFKAGLVSWRPELTLDHNDLVVVIIALEQQMILLLIDFQIAARIQSMELMLEVFVVNDVSCNALGAEGGHIQTQIRKCNQIMSSLVHETTDLGFPEAETFMSTDDWALFEVDDIDAVNVDMNRFEAYNQLRPVCGKISDDVHVDCCDVQLVGTVHDHQISQHLLLVHIERILLREPQQIVSKLLILLIGQDKELIFKEKHVLDVCDTKFFV